MALFRNRTERDDGLTRDEVRREETDVRGWGSPPLVRAVFTLIGVAAAGLLIWLAQTFDLTNTDEFWAGMGLIAAAGLALGLSQLFGGWTKWGWPIMSPGVFLLAFIPTGIVVGWILLATQPEGGWQQGRFSGWSSDIGISGLVSDLGTLPAALAMGLGIVFAFTFDTTGPRTRRVVEAETIPDEDVHDYDRRDDAVTTTPVADDTAVNDRTMVSAGETRTERVEVRDPERRDTP
ncbi:MAG: hypothetical protein ABI649_04430 [Gaiellaceae bacterium]